MRLRRGRYPVEPGSAAGPAVPASASDDWFPFGQVEPWPSRSRTSATAVLTVALAVAAWFAALTGLPNLGLASGLLALMLGPVALVIGGLPRMTGRGVAATGVLAGAGATALCVALLTGTLTLPTDWEHAGDLEHQLGRLFAAVTDLVAG